MKLLDKIDERGPYDLPNFEKYKRWVHTLTPRKLQFLLMKETCERYNAQKILSENGFIQNKRGRWIAPKEIENYMVEGE